MCAGSHNRYRTQWQGRRPRPDRADQIGTLLPLDEVNRFPSGEGLGLLGEESRGDDYCPLGALRRHHPEGLSHHLDPNLVDLPMFTLDNEIVPVLSEDQVHSPIGAVPPGAGDRVALPTVGLPHQRLELLP